MAISSLEGGGVATLDSSSGTRSGTVRVESGGSSQLRVGDRDRDMVARRLGAALAEGRLDLDEFDERVAKAYAAKTAGDLAGLTADLPGGGAVAVPASPLGVAPGGDPVIARFGQLTVTATAVITPTGTYPLAGSRWHLLDEWREVRTTPTWAVAAAVGGFFVMAFFSLFFLLCKETQCRGDMVILIDLADGEHTCRIPVRTPADVAMLRRQVAQVRSLAAR